MPCPRPDPIPPTIPEGGPTATIPLGLLLEGYDYARQLKRDVWEFAVEIRCLLEEGLTHNDVRWLLCKGYVEHAVERTEPGGRRREFQRVANLSLSERVCLVLTETGTAYARAVAQTWAERAGRNGRENRPVWDAVRRELRVGNVVVKRFRQPAGNQEKVLAAFEEEGWPARVDDPLPPQPGQDAKRRLHSTISNLNRSQEHALIHFEGGGDGQSVGWRLLAPGKASEGRANTGRV